jgi:hypothetical protein
MKAKAKGEVEENLEFLGLITFIGFTVLIAFMVPIIASLDPFVIGVLGRIYFSEPLYLFKWI